MKKIFAILAFILAASSALAFGSRGASSPDPFILNTTGLLTINRNANSLTLRTLQGTNPAQRTLVLITGGQSQGTNNMPTPYTPTNASAVDQLSIYDGGIRNAQDPLVGVDSLSGDWITRLADDYITAGTFDRVIVVPAGIGSTSIAQWDTGILGNRMAVAYKRVAQKITCGATNVVCAMLWIHGESDCALGTSLSAYTTGLNDVIAAVRAAGFTVSGVAGNGIIFVNSESNKDGTTTCSAITAAEAAVVNHAAGVWAGFNMDALVGNICGAAGNAACRQAGYEPHLTDAGAYSAAGTGGGGERAAMHLFGSPF